MADALSELQAWGDSMRGRTVRQFALQGSTPSGWHVLLPDGDFGFLEVQIPASAEDHLQLVARAREYMRTMAARACMFVAERELPDGRPVLYQQFEAIDARGRRSRALTLHRIASGPQGRHVDTSAALDPAGAEDADWVRNGLFPDLLPDPPSPLRIL